MNKTHMKKILIIGGSTLAVAGLATILTITTGSDDKLLERTAVLQSQGKYEEARTQLSSALARREKEKKEDALTVSLLNRLGDIEKRQSRVESSRMAFDRAQKIQTRLMTPQMVALSGSLLGLGQTYTQAGKYERAEDLLQQALTIRQAHLQAGDPAIADTQNALGELYFAAGFYPQAEALYKQASVTYQKIYGAESAQSAMVRGNLAGLYFAQGKAAQAEPLLRWALSTSEKASGATSVETANTLTNLGEVLRYQKRYSEAEPLVKRAVAIYETTVGKDSPVYGNALNNLALIYRNQNKMTDAETLYKQSIAVYDRSGSTTPAQSGVLANYGELLQATGRTAEASVMKSRAANLKVALR